MLEKKLEGNEARDAKLELGNWLKNRREEIGRSQGDIAKHMQFQNLNFISKIERGAGAVPLSRYSDSKTWLKRTKLIFMSLPQE